MTGDKTTEGILGGLKIMEGIRRQTMLKETQGMDGVTATIRLIMGADGARTMTKTILAEAGVLIIIRAMPAEDGMPIIIRTMLVEDGMLTITKTLLMLVDGTPTTIIRPWPAITGGPVITTTMTGSSKESRIGTALRKQQEGSSLLRTPGHENSGEVDDDAERSNVVVLWLVASPRGR